MALNATVDSQNARKWIFRTSVDKVTIRKK